MKVVVLGGGGDEGGAVVDILAKEADFEKVIAADRSEKRIERVAQQVGAKAEARVVDLYDHNALIRLLKEADIVVNTVGPFYRHGTTVLNAAIETRVDYVDICDDYDPTIQMLKLDSAAKEAGITALIGMGSSPGIVNILAIRGAKKLDHTEEIRILWCVNYASAGGGAGAGFHGWHMMRGNIPQFLDGKLVNVQAGTGKEIVEFPNGSAEVFYLGHPEPITIPPFVPGVKTVVNKGTITPQWLSEDQLKMIELGFGQEEMIAIHPGLSAAPVEVALRVQNLYLRDKDMGPPWAGMLVEVKGTKAGKKSKCSYSIPPEIAGSGSMSTMTAGPAATGTLMISRGEVNMKGVITPEALDIDRFLNLVSKLGGEDWDEIEAIPQKLHV